MGAAGQGTTIKGKLELDLAVFVKGTVKAYSLLITGAQITKLGHPLLLRRTLFCNQEAFFSTSVGSSPRYIK